MRDKFAFGYRRALPSLLILGVLAMIPLAAEEIPFDPVRGLVEVEVTLDGRVKGNFGIDTGADRLYIDRTFAEKNRLTFAKKVPQRDVVGIEGRSEAQLLELRSLQIGHERLYNLTPTAIDLGSLTKSSPSGYPDGLLGHEVLRRFYVTIDYPSHKLHLQMREPDFVEKRDYLAIPFENHRHLILVDVVLDDSVKASMILDYCASYTSITPTLARRLGVASELDSRPVIGSVRMGGQALTRDVTVIVTDLSQIQKTVPRAEFEGILGASFLYGHKITVDYRRRQVYVHQQ